jgi:succinate dehydrogenase / fumarate reductase cytochrome b subunit
MNWLQRYLSSTIGLKLTLALSGLILIGFVFVHMLGNLQIFLQDGGRSLNAYSAFLKDHIKLLWVARITLLIAVVAHISSAVALVMRSKAARPVSNQKSVWLGSDYAARTMRWGGVILFAFIIFHIAHLTIGAAVPGSEGIKHCLLQGGEYTCFVKENIVGQCRMVSVAQAGDASAEAATSLYTEKCTGFKNLPLAVFYIVAQIALSLHLAHGIWSLCRTLGLNNPRFDRLARRIAAAIALIVLIGNCSIPIAVQLGRLTALQLIN